MAETFGSLLRTLQQVQSQVLDAAAGNELTGTQLSVLSAVVNDPGIDQRGVTAATFIDKSTVASVVAKLADRGLLVSSRNDDDARRGSLAPAGDAVRLVYEVSLRLREGNRSMLTELTPRKRENFLGQLRRVAYCERDEPSELYVIPSPDGDRPPLEVRWGLGRALRGCLQRYGRLWTEQFGSLVTPVQYLALKALEDTHGIDQNTLGSVIGLDKASLTEMLVRLQRRGLVIKLRDPLDGRRRLLELAPPAGVLLSGADSQVPAVDAEFVSPLQPAQRPAFRDALRTLAAANRARSADALA